MVIMVVQVMVEVMVVVVAVVAVITWNSPPSQSCVAYGGSNDVLTFRETTEGRENVVRGVFPLATCLSMTLYR